MAESKKRKNKKTFLIFNLIQLISFKVLSYFNEGSCNVF